MIAEIINLTARFHPRYHMAFRAVEFVVERKRFPDGTWTEGFCPLCYATEELAKLNFSASVGDNLCDWEIIGRRAALGEIMRKYTHVCQENG